MNLEQVKEYFKDTVKARCLSNNLIYDISRGKFIVAIDNSIFFNEKGGDCVKLYDGNSGDLAEKLCFLNNVECATKPEHYKTESIDVIDFCKEYNLNFNKGNIIKYICRAGKKENEPELKDLEKALVYLQREINYLNQN